MDLGPSTVANEWPESLGVAEAEQATESSQSLIPAYSPQYIGQLVDATRLCQPCLNLFASDDRNHAKCPYYAHHATYASFRQSLVSGCMICTKLLKTINMGRKNALTGNEPKHSVPDRPDVFSYCYFHKVLIHTDAEGQDRAVWLTKAQLSEHKDYINLQPRNSLAFVEHWLNICTGARHPTCRGYRQPGKPLAKPTRLLYLNPERPDYVQLITVDTEKAQGARASNHYPYVTLSHRWGTPPPPKLSDCQLPENTHEGEIIPMERLEHGYPIMKLPRTFQDAIIIVRACKLVYLWIDSLCIVQVKRASDVEPTNFGGSESDWATEATKMGDIYAGGVFNIAAADGKNSDWSLFPQQKWPLAPVLKDSLQHCTDHDSGEGFLIYADPPTEHFEREIISSELLSRGWVFQEVLLAPANLFCTQEMIWWSCFQMSASQLFPKGTKAVKDYALVDELFTDILREQKVDWNNGEDIIGAWMRMICSYSGTSVTRSTDRMVAIAGVAKLYTLRFPMLRRHHSGVWATQVVRQILWKPDHDRPLPTKRYESEGAYIPSWSPLSCDGLCIHTRPWYRVPAREEILAKSKGFETRNIDNFGRSKDTAGAVLHIQGVLVLLRRHDTSIDNKPEDYMYTMEHDLPIYGSYDSQMERMRAESSTEDSVYAVACLIELPIDQEEEEPWQCVSGLLLRRNDGTGKHWVRCGTFYTGEEENVSLLAEIFGLERYGWTEVVNENGSGTDYMVPPGAALDLDDIYMV